MGENENLDVTEGGLDARPAPKTTTWTPEGGVGAPLYPASDEVSEGEDEKPAAPADKKTDPKEPEGSQKDEKPAEAKPASDDKDKPKPAEGSAEAENKALREEIASMRGQMAEILEALEQPDEEPAKKGGLSEGEQQLKSELDKIPDDELTPVEKQMKAMLKAQAERLDALNADIRNESVSRRVREYETRFDKISAKHNKDGEEWLDDNDKNLIANIALDYNSDDIEGLAEKLIEKRKGLIGKLIDKEIEKRMPELKQKAIKEYLGMKKEDRTKVVEKSGDAPPPPAKKLSLDRPRALKTLLADRLRKLAGTT